MNKTILPLLVLLLLPSLRAPLWGQGSGDSVGSGRFAYLRDEPPQQHQPVPERRVRTGFYVGLTVDYMNLAPSALASDLGGTPVIFGEEGVLLLNGIVVGAAGGSVQLYNANPATHDFSYSYLGVLLGYEISPVSGRAFFIRPSVLIGGGGISATRNRPDLSVTAGGTILEEVRNQSYLLFRPHIAFSYPLAPYADIGVGVGYLLPTGHNASDFATWTVGGRLMLGFGL